MEGRAYRSRVKAFFIGEMDKAFAPPYDAELISQVFNDASSVLGEDYPFFEKVLKSPHKESFVDYIASLRGLPETFLPNLRWGLVEEDLPELYRTIVTATADTDDKLYNTIENDLSYFSNVVSHPSILEVMYEMMPDMIDISPKKYLSNLTQVQGGNPDALKNLVAFYLKHQDLDNNVVRLIEGVFKYGWEEIPLNAFTLLDASQLKDVAIELSDAIRKYGKIPMRIHHNYASDAKKVKVPFNIGEILQLFLEKAALTGTQKRDLLSSFLGNDYFAKDKMDLAGELILRVYDPTYPRKNNFLYQNRESLSKFLRNLMLIFSVIDGDRTLEQMIDLLIEETEKRVGKEIPLSEDYEKAKTRFGLQIYTDFINDFIYLKSHVVTFPLSRNKLVSLIPEERRFPLENQRTINDLNAKVWVGVSGEYLFTVTLVNEGNKDNSKKTYKLLLQEGSLLVMPGFDELSIEEREEGEVVSYW